MSLMKNIYQAALNNGLSPNQARAFTAEVGRENDFNPKYIFGEHRDSNRDNVGIISWNQGRRINLYRYLQSRGISTKGGIERTQRALDAQMAFAIHEMKTNPAYKATKKLFLDNPNVDYRTAEKVLGKNFIRWDYAGNSLGASVRKHHAKRDKYYAQLGGVVGSPGRNQAMPQFQRPARRPLSELLAANKPAIEPFQRPQRRPLSELLGQPEVIEPFQRPARRPISELLAQNEPMVDSGIIQPEQPPIVTDEVVEPMFTRPERKPLSELLAANASVEQPNAMLEPDTQEWLN